MSNSSGQLKPAEIRSPFEEALLPDWLLQKWVDVVNTSGVSVSITLSVGGILVSGQLIGGKEYFELLRKWVEDGFAPHVRSCFATLYDAIEELGTIYDHGFVEPTEVFRLSERSREPDRDPPVHIHLKDARFLVGGSTPIGGSVLWRGRLGSVDGFCFGILEP